MADNDEVVLLMVLGIVPSRSDEPIGNKHRLVPIKCQSSYVKESDGAGEMPMLAQMARA